MTLVFKTLTVLKMSWRRWLGAFTEKVCSRSSNISSRRNGSRMLSCSRSSGSNGGSEKFVMRIVLVVIADENRSAVSVAVCR